MWLIKAHTSQEASTSTSESSSYVAATRAKERFSIIGDLELWGKLNFFKDAKEVLDKFNKE